MSNEKTINTPFPITGEGPGLGAVGRYPFLAEPFHCDFRQELFLGHLGNMMLNAADFHSTDRGFGCRFLNTQKKTWVLSRLAIEIEEMPRQYDKFFIETWVESAMRYFTNRNFKVSSPEGKPLVWGRSIWAMINLETRQPCNIFDVNDGSITDWEEKDYPDPIAPPSRVKMQPTADSQQPTAEFVAQYSDVDINGHVNSVKYIEHILDLFVDKDTSIKRVDIAYVAEAHKGDTLRFYETSEPQNLKTSETHLVRITKLTPEGETECCRASVILQKL